MRRQSIFASFGHSMLAMISRSGVAKPLPQALSAEGVAEVRGHGHTPARVLAMIAVVARRAKNHVAMPGVNEMHKVR